MTRRRTTIRAGRERSGKPQAAARARPAEDGAAAWTFTHEFVACDEADDRAERLRRLLAGMIARRIINEANRRTDATLGQSPGKLPGGTLPGGESGERGESASDSGGGR